MGAPTAADGAPDRLQFISAAAAGELRLVVDLLPGDALTLRLVRIEDVPGTPPPLASDIDLVRVNGGAPPGSREPMTLLEAVPGDAAGAVILHGLGLDQLGLVWLESDRSAAVALDHVRREDGGVVVTLPAVEPERAGSARLVVATTDGAHDWIAVPGDASLDAESGGWSVTFVVDRARAPVVEDASWAIPVASLPLSEVTEVLRAEGVVELRAFAAATDPAPPTRNRLGEPIMPVDPREIFSCEVAAEGDALRLVSRLERLPGVRRAIAAPRRGMRPMAPDDPLFPRQWALSWTGSYAFCGVLQAAPGTDIGYSTAWPQPAEPTVDVAVLDTGFEVNHPDLRRARHFGCFYAPDCPYGDSSVDGHGTSVTSIIAAQSDNAEGMTSPTSAARAWAFVVCQDQSCNAAHVASALNQANQDGRFPIANLSIGGFDDDPGLALAVKNAWLDGTLVVSVMAETFLISPLFPAAWDRYVLGVGAQFMNGLRWVDFEINGQNGLESDPAPYIDLCAPGGRLIIAAKKGETYYDVTPSHCSIEDVQTMAFEGTSAAGAYVSAVAAALVHQRRTMASEDLTAEDLEAILKLSAADREEHGLGWDEHTGAGLARGDAALAMLSVPNALLHTGAGAGTPWALGIADSSGPLLAVSVQGHPSIPNGTYWARRYELRGVVDRGAGWTQAPYAWTRGSGTLGWRDTTHLDWVLDAPWADVGPGAPTASQVPVRTYVYRLVAQGDPGVLVGWFPCDPAQARIALSILNPGTALDAPAAAAGPAPLVRLLGNPGRGEIRYALAAEAGAEARVSIHDVSGRRLHSEVVRLDAASAGVRVWPVPGGTTRAPRPGVYFLRVVAGDRSETRTCVVLR